MEKSNSNSIITFSKSVINLPRRSDGIRVMSVINQNTQNGIVLAGDLPKLPIIKPKSKRVVSNEIKKIKLELPELAGPIPNI